MAFPLLQTKLFIPPAQNLLHRSYLIQTLEEGRKDAHRLFLISSSAGSGKTSLLSEWAAQRQNEFAWLSLDEEDNETSRFWRYLLAAIQRTQPGFGQDAAALLDLPQPVPMQTILVALLNDFVNTPNPVILVLDDYHAIGNAEIHSGITYLLEHLPPNISLVISTRADPPIPIVRLRAYNQLTEIREANLRFSIEEAASFLSMMGLNLSRDDILAIVTRTEGWIAGLQLAGLALRAYSSRQNNNFPDHHPFISSFTTSHQHILDYLAEEVLSQLDRPLQEFLVKTSILERMCAELCEEVVQGQAETQTNPSESLSSGPSVLAYLEHANLFTIPLDEERHWYRYHHLFADLLSHRLQETFSSDDIQKLHCRASAWLARNDLIDEAIQHALLGLNFKLAASLIEPLARTMMFSGRVNALKHWIRALPEDILETHLRLKIFGIWIDLMQGICELSRQKVQEAEQLIQSLPSSPENDQLKVELMVILCRFIAISGDTAQAIRVANEALRVLPENDLASRARVKSALAIAYGLDGNVEKSEAAFQECFELARSSAYYSLLAHTTMLVAIGESHYGKLREPARKLQEVIDLGLHTGQKVFFPAGQGYVGLASIYLEWNKLETAEKLLQQGIELCSQAGLDGVFSGLILKARLLQAKGDLKGALEEIQSVEKSFQRKDHDTTARQVQILLAMGDLHTVSNWIAPLTALVNAEPSAQKIPFLFLETFQITLARILLACGEIEQALRQLDAIQTKAEPGKRSGHLIEIYLLKTLATQKQHGGEITLPALEYFRKALELAEPEGYTLLFLEMGAEIIPFINAINLYPETQNRLKRYTAHLLAAFPGKEHLITSSAPKSGKEASEEITDLSQREIEILQLIGEGCSNQEIAERLVITLHTVKKHSSHIFAKLGVTSRTQAVARARQVGLL